MPVLLSQDLRDVQKRYWNGEPVTAAELYVSRLDIEFLEEKLAILEGHLPHLLDLRLLEHCHAANQANGVPADNPGVWQQSVFMAGMDGVPCIRLTPKGLALLSDDGRSDYIVVLLTDSGEWITVRQSSRLLNLVESRGSAEDLLKWLADIQRRTHCVDPADYGLPYSLQLADDIDGLVLANQAAGDECCASWHSDVSALQQLNQRVLGTTRIRTQAA